jgi:hypothetical protein
MDVADADGGINRRWLAFHAANIVQPAAARDNLSQRMIAVSAGMNFFRILTGMV